MKKYIKISVMFFLLGGSMYYLLGQNLVISIKLKEFNQKYAENVMKPSSGDSKETVLEKMGGIVMYKVKLGIMCNEDLINPDPDHHKLFSTSEGRQVEILTFITKLKKKGCSIIQQKKIPFVFEDDQLIGKGQDFLREYLKANHD